MWAKDTPFLAKFMRLEQRIELAVWGQQIHNLSDALCNSTADFITMPVTISKAFRLVCLIAVEDWKLATRSRVELWKIKACHCNVIQMKPLETKMLFLVTDSVVTQPNEQLSWSNASLVPSLYLFMYCQKLLTSDRYIKRPQEQFVSVSASPHYWVGRFLEFSKVKGAFVFGGAGFCMISPSWRDSESSFTAQTLTVLAYNSSSQLVFILGPDFILDIKERLNMVPE